MPRDTSLRQRGNRRYSFAEHGNTTQGQRQGKYIIKNNLADHWNPCYGDGVTVIRIYPQRNPEDTSGESWDPYRFSAEYNAFGDWLRMYPAARSMGNPSCTFIMSDRSTGLMENEKSLPAWVLFDAIDQAVTNGQEQQGWAAMLKGGKGRGAMLPRPSEVYLVQCAIMQHKTQQYNPPKGFNPDDKPIVMELSQSAGLAMLAELNLVNEVAQPIEGDWESMFLSGDPISLDTGRFVTFYKLGDGDPRQAQVQEQGGWNAPQQGGVGGREKQIGYGCFLEPTFNGIPANLRAYEATVASKVCPWEDILWFPTVEEQANLLASSFPPDVILYAFRDHPEWIPETVRRTAVAATQVAAPQAADQRQQPGAPAQPTAVTAPGVPPAGPAFPAAAPAGFGAPAPVEAQPQAQAPAQPQGFGAPAPAQAPMPGTAAPIVAAPAGPTGGPPPVAPPQGFGAPAQPVGFGAPPAAEAPADVAPQPATVPPTAPDAGEMAWGQQGNPVAQAPVAQTELPVAGVPPVAAASPPMQVQQPGVPGQAPNAMTPPPAAQPSRAQAALAAAQAAVAGQQPSQQ